MPESVLTLLKLCLIVLLYLFFFRVVRAVWFEMRATDQPPAPAPPPAAARAAAPSRPVAAPAPAPGAGPATTLTVTAPPELAGQRFALATTEMTIGRGPGCAILLGDQTVSTIHARIAARGSERIVEDLESRNGTFVNKRRITGPTALHVGDRVGIGPVVVLEAG
jgi:pSer/pThr/pTyr-binding forkhead associated (FHA) protein